ncbi:MAG: hypothetical protein OWU32_05365 [Firmicutes bacterium]|nr:hypothetical protein [Bacillota bacterium]
MKPHFVLCDRCLEPIESRADLVSTLVRLRPIAFHNACFVDALKDRSRRGMSAYPINSVSTNVSVALGCIVCLIGFAITHVWLFLIAAMVGPAIRAWSWWLFERHLDN